jgi:DNA invertase Pin-like site-specific DNA recombinase
MQKTNYICYFRVSTQRQGRSGLGLDAQRKSVADYLADKEANIIDEVTEIESGRHTKRIKLKAAIDLCKATNATLLVAKFDRLSRNAKFLLELQASGVRISAADMPDVDELVVGIMAMVAQHEAKAISTRTSAALQAAKARGVVLGAYAKDDKSKFIGRCGTREDALNANAARAAKYREVSLGKIRSLEHFDPDNSLSSRVLAKVFNNNGIPTVSGKGTWSSNSILRLKKLRDSPKAALSGS